MGLEDRDYMRERVRTRSRKVRTSPLEELLASPFNNQGAAFATIALGLVLISDMPVSLIASMAPGGPIDPTNPADIINGSAARGSAIAALTFTPLIRIAGLVLLVASGIALISRRKRWGYSKIVKDPMLTAGIGGAALLIAAFSLLSQGVWEGPARRAAAIATRIAERRPAVRTKNVPMNPQTVAPATVVVPVPGTVPPGVPTEYRPATMTPGLRPGTGLEQDRPFPANGTFERTLPLQGKIARMTFANRSPNNVIAVWFYNLNEGKGDQEALRLYVTAGQSATIDIPAFDYRMALYEAPTAYGLDRGFGPDARMRDLGLIDLKTPAVALAQQPVGTYQGYGIYTARPGILLPRR